MVKTHDWGYLAATSHYLLAKEIKFSLQEGDIEDAIEGLDELIDSMSKIAIREMRSHLVIIMTHILKWKYQPQKRSWRWRISISNARDEIEEVQEETPSVTKKTIETEWDKVFKKAIRQSADQMGMSSDEEKNFNPEPLTWEEVFEKEYYLEDED
jgi:N-methylhydantoinase A/oxoprolinase/acetone carboxylase beta subunit